MSFGDGSWNKDRTRARSDPAARCDPGRHRADRVRRDPLPPLVPPGALGRQYLAEAQGNRVREVTVQAPRGEILDRDGEVLVGNRTALALQVRKDELPEDSGERAKVLKRVAEVTGMSLEQIRKEIDKQTKLLPANPVTLQRDVPESVVFFVRENQAKFQGVSVDRVYVRQYPQGSTAAHLLGYVKEVERRAARGAGVHGPRARRRDRPGRGGALLRQRPPGRERRDARAGRRRRARRPGARRASARADAGERPGALDRLGPPGGGRGRPSSAAAALLSRSTSKTGEILAMGSAPTFDPSAPREARDLHRDFEAIFGDPDDTLGTRCARLQPGDRGRVSDRLDLQARHCACGARRGQADAVRDHQRRRALSSGRRRSSRTPATRIYGPLALQRRAQGLLGRLLLHARRPPAGEHRRGRRRVHPGLGEVARHSATSRASTSRARLSARVPTPEWRNDLFENGDTDRPWSVGDNINLSVGQGDLLAAPLQLAVAYAALGNGGTVVTPHVGLRTEDPDGKVVQEIAPPPGARGRDRRRLAGSDHGWPRLRRDGARRHVLSGVRLASRSTSRARPVPPKRSSMACTSTRPGTRRSRLRTIPRSPSSTRSRGAASASTAPRRPQSRSSRSTHGNTFRYLSVKSMRQRRLRRTQQVPW